jgi:23S rRNA pseudouridine2605 synthase
MARRHEDRKPGQRFVRDPQPGAPARGESGDAGGRKPFGRKPSGSRPSGRRPSGSRPSDSKPSGGRPASGGKPPAARGGGFRGTGGKASGPRQPRGSTRRAQGLVVTPAVAPGTAVEDGKVRLNHFLAMSGVSSRRAADELIRAGRVEVNGELCTELGTRVDPVHDDVRYDGSRVQPERPTYVLFNKPKGVVCTNWRHEQKKRVIDFLPDVRGRLFTVGRLDLDSEGLILLTNDGRFALEMTHPRYGVPKLYSVLVRGRIEQADLDKARGGVWLAEGPTAGMNVKIERTGNDRTYMKVTLREGKNREIRRVFAKLGYPVLELKRVRIGELNLHGLAAGGWRFLQLHEVEALRTVARQKGDDGDFGEN